MWSFSNERERERNKEISEATFYIKRKERENKTIYKKILSHSLIFLTSNHFLNKEKYKNKPKQSKKNITVFSARGTRFHLSLPTLVQSWSVVNFSFFFLFEARFEPKTPRRAIMPKSWQSWCCARGNQFSVYAAPSLFSLSVHFSPPSNSGKQWRDLVWSGRFLITLVALFSDFQLSLFSTTAKLDSIFKCATSRADFDLKWVLRQMSDFV